ncbi:unnamed protein product [Lactuca virosa]|uniref:Chlorophyll a-b binding protein, chloroplastic n=1 Tax=Lactuca virosa TaxID=75947 RepID=A0AAU9M8M7_9ASTR|nr:unnamed protein product [Lactuca virosa]
MFWLTSYTHTSDAHTLHSSAGATPARQPQSNLSSKFKGQQQLISHQGLNFIIKCGLCVQDVINGDLCEQFPTLPLDI